MPEHPLVPDVDARIAADRAGQVRVEMQRQRPGEGERQEDVSRQRGEPSAVRPEEDARAE